jgi:Ca-activated chloride channel family protein
MNSTTFAYPYLLLLLLILPLLLWWQARRRGRPVLRFSSLETLRDAGGSAQPRMLLPILQTIGLAALIVAAARPQVSDVTKKLYAEGIAIQMVLDISGSMENEDMSKLRGQGFTRLAIVKDVFRRFVLGDEDALEGRPNDLIGLIQFARYADSVCPLTLDRDQLINFLDEAKTIQGQIEDLVENRRRSTSLMAQVNALKEEDGTAIGDALALAVERLKDLRRTSGSGDQHVIKSRVIVLLTDGEDNASLIEPRKAGDLAAKYGIKVYTIMAGTGMQVGFGRVPVDDSDLRYIAETTGGRHFAARTPGALLEVYEAIDKLERTKTEEKRFLRKHERAQPWLLAAFIALAGQQVLAATWLRKLP